MDANRDAARRETARQEHIMAIRHETRKWFCGLGLGPFPPHELIPIFWYLGHNPVGNTPQKIKDLNESEADQILRTLSVWKEGTLAEKLLMVRVCAGDDVDSPQGGSPGSSRDASENGFLQNLINTTR